jgi:hypothetical protein
MKTITSAVLVSIVLSGLALASQSGDQMDHPSMMQEMIKGEKGMEGMGGMGGMMRMMKMMDQCGAMMESTHDQGGKAKESQNK